METTAQGQGRSHQTQPGEALDGLAAAREQSRYRQAAKGKGQEKQLEKKRSSLGVQQEAGRLRPYRQGSGF